jgi:hypothetical protein
LIFLSADHGGANAEGFLRANKILGGFFDEGMEKNLGQNWKRNMPILN